MIRRDYILRMIEEFFQVLARIKGLKQGQLWQEASGAVDEEFQRLIGAGAQAVGQLTETELLSRLIRGEPTQAVHEKTLMLTALLKEAGDVAAARGQSEESRSCYLKGLHLLLDALAQGEVSDYPDFVPRVEVFLAALAEAPLPLSTQARLMQHYERAGEFARAEDALFAMLDEAPDNPALAEFGIAFYQRLQGQSDAGLAAGNLPRAELEAGLAELHGRRVKGGYAG
jgi:hypothetical protein